MRETLNTNVNKLKNSELFNTVNSRKELLVSEFRKEMSDKSSESFYSHLKDFYEYPSLIKSVVSAVEILLNSEFEGMSDEFSHINASKQMFAVSKVLGLAEYFVEVYKENPDSFDSGEILEFLNQTDIIFNNKLEKNMIFPLQTFVNELLVLEYDKSEIFRRKVDDVFFAFWLVIGLENHFYVFLNKVKSIIYHSK